MGSKAKFPVWILYIAVMLVLILDSKTAIANAAVGVSLCTQSVIPSIFPLIVLSGMLTGSLSDINIPNLKSFNKLLNIPSGSELLVVLGFLGGYPVGAQNICNAYLKGFLKRDTAKRMLVFCNNAGPAFIFGIVAGQFDTPQVGWYLWGIIVVSSLLTAIILPGRQDGAVTLTQSGQNSAHVLTNAVRAIGCICGWVVIFRVLLGLAERWLLHRLPIEVNVVFSGLLELTNGCLQLRNISGEFERFAASAVLLSFGGICVLMQTATTAMTLGMEGYLPGKLLQSCISYILCLTLQPLLFPDSMQWLHLILGLILLIFAYFSVFYFKYRNKEKNAVAF